MGIDYAKLAAPFDPSDIEWRIQQSGMKDGRAWGRVLAYVTSRAVMNRLDEVVGPGNWKVQYEFINVGEKYRGIICHLSIKIGDEWVTKCDGAEATDIESFKGGISSALKRAAVTWGIGRYLYKLESNWAQVVRERGPNSHVAKVKTDNGYKYFYWEPPELPAWALPRKSGL
jgi:hypothetical protein